MMTKHYDIMTSCDGNLIRYIPIQLFSISKSQPNSSIDFYLFHRNIEAEKLEQLDAFCQCLGNIQFHDIIVPEPEKYDAIAKHGGKWPGEAYYSLCAHELLPESIGRILYIDAADVIVTGDISPYYNCNFAGNALIVTSIRYKMLNEEIVSLEEQDLYEKKEGFPGICRGLFNSGSYVINLDKLREAQLTIDDYFAFSQILCELSGNKGASQVYFGDQGFLSAAFVGDMKIYDYPEIRYIWHMPYNFCLWYYDRVNEMPPYHPAIVHFAGTFKPWKVDYPIEVARFLDPKERHGFREMKIGQAEWYYLWHEFAICTDEMLRGMGY